MDRRPPWNTRMRLSTSYDLLSLDGHRQPPVKTVQPEVRGSERVCRGGAGHHVAPRGIDPAPARSILGPVPNTARGSTLRGADGVIAGPTAPAMSSSCWRRAVTASR